MLELPDVTLVLIETREHDLAQLALEDCERHAKFGDVLVFTDRPAQFLRAGRRIITVEDWPEKIGWSRCFWYDVALQVKTAFTLGIQWDSWITDPEMWRDEYLAYDYIGAPWLWYNDGMNVGNGGFCLRSTKLLRYIQARRDKFPCLIELDDDLYCRKYRPELQHAGFVWAPASLARDFAFETARPEPTSRHFGFHAAYNFDYGCGTEERLIQRAKIMSRSDYITRSHPYIWNGLAKKCPEIAHLKELSPETVSRIEAGELNNALNRVMQGLNHVMHKGDHYG